MIQLEQVVKHYAGGMGVGPVDFGAADGEVCGIVGPNGAGKSTLFGIIAGTVEHYAGSWVLDGANLQDIERGTIGYLPEEPFCFPSFTPREFCAFDSGMRDLGLSAGEIDGHLKSFGCGHFADTKISRLSQGMAKRVSIACAFAGNPRLILLDEPLNAIDIMTTISLKEHVLRAKQRGCTVLISSHILDFIDEVADRVIFLDEGVIVADFNPRDVKAENMYKRCFM
ncbi:ABC-2 type transport system ATP-binding protein [Olsenella profusa DSM 13989]|uniref:ABC transporter ATP-binding protein n=1 Tax=Olsenella profusa TaxID=138595 RepID=UPI00277E8EAD|nr:ABC transporter ATP-binding protein [Olsenella profusa]MDP9860529.1 ABC-2 type transport system ATP-binding protein [Olsenella profusa DSM 13989]